MIKDTIPIFTPNGMNLNERISGKVQQNNKTNISLKDLNEHGNSICTGIRD